jgi:hypothetical protein
MLGGAGFNTDGQPRATREQEPLTFIGAEQILALFNR